jgi:hypothetical protein
MNYYQTQVSAVVHFQTLGRQGLLRRVLELVWHQKEPVLLQMLPGLGLLQMVQEQVSSHKAQQLELGGAECWGSRVGRSRSKCWSRRGTK